MSNELITAVNATKLANVSNTKEIKQAHNKVAAYIEGTALKGKHAVTVTVPPNTCAAVVDKLRKAGYEVTTAMSGPEILHLHISWNN